MIKKEGGFAVSHDVTSREDVRNLSERLAKDCQELGLRTEILTPARVRVSDPSGHSRLTEVVRCMPSDRADDLMWWWSWGEPICHADDTARAAAAIAHVVSAGHPNRLNGKTAFGTT